MKLVFFFCIHFIVGSVVANTFMIICYVLVSSIETIPKCLYTFCHCVDFWILWLLVSFDSNLSSIGMRYSYCFCPSPLPFVIMSIENMEFSIAMSIELEFDMFELSQMLWVKKLLQCCKCCKVWKFNNVLLLHCCECCRWELFWKVNFNKLKFKHCDSVLGFFIGAKTKMWQLRSFILVP